MSVDTTDTYSGPYSTNGVTTVFPFSFATLAADEVAVEINGAVVSSTSYSVGLTDNGGTVTFDAAPAAGAALYILSDPDFKQQITFEDGSKYLAKPVNDVNDRAAIRDLALKARIDRAPLIPVAGGVSGKFAVVDGSGGWAFASGTGADGALRSDLADDDGASLVGFSIGRSMADRAKFDIALPDAVLSNDSNENNALASLFDDGYRRIRLPAAKGFGDGGAYLLETMAGINNLASGAHLIGDGRGKTFISRPYALVDQEVDAGASGLGQIFFANGSSADPADNITDLTFSGFTLLDDLPGYGVTPYGDLERLRGYREGANLIFLNGVSNVLFEQLQFIGFRGDGICLGSGHTNATEKHNIGITLRDIYMDGFDRNTRNGLSIIDCDGLLVDNFYGKNVTRSGDGTNNPTNPFNPSVGLGNPGLIDCEPDHAWNVIRHIEMRSIHAKNCGGSTVALLLRDQDVIDVPHQHFNINLTSENCDQGFSFNGYNTTAIGNSTAIPYHVNVHGSIKGATKAAWQLSGLHRGRIALAVEDSADAHLGYDGLPTVGCRDVDLYGSSFLRGGNANGNAIAIDAATRNCAIERIEFDDCGKPDGSVGRCTFIRNGAHEVLRINENLLTNVSRMTQAFGVVGGFAGTIDNMTCQKNGNVLKFTPATADNFKPTGVGYGEIAAVNVNPASIAAGALSTPFTITVTGARVGDFVDISAVPYVGDKMELLASVSANDTVSVWIRNDTAGAVDLPATDFYVQVTTRPGR